jgi:hypothetical protein
MLGLASSSTALFVSSMSYLSVFHNIFSGVIHIKWGLIVEARRTHNENLQSIRLDCCFVH